MENFTSKVNFIYENTKEYPHSGKTFFEHLLNTSNIIRKLFPKEQYLIDAGLFHSIYGTCYYKFDSKNSRKKIKSIIGEKSENLVYIFCTLENRTFQIIQNNFEDDVHRDLLILEYANYLEQNCYDEPVNQIKKLLYEKFYIKLPEIKKNNLNFSYY